MKRIALTITAVLALGVAAPIASAAQQPNVWRSGLQPNPYKYGFEPNPTRYERPASYKYGKPSVRAGALPDSWGHGKRAKPRCGTSCRRAEV